MFHFNKKMPLFLLLAIVLVLILVIKKPAKPVRKLNRRWLNLAETLQKQTYILHKKNSCKKTATATNYTICETLPLLPITCGDLAKKRDFDQFGKKYKIPNIVYLILVRNVQFDFLKYLALRSVARIQQPEAVIIYYTTVIPTSKFAKKAIREIPCLRWVKVKDPLRVNGKQISADSRAEVIRFTKLIKHGGIYVDNDVILLKNLDSFRHFSFVAGREHALSINAGILLAEPNSKFLNKFYHESFLKAFENYDPKVYYKYAQNGLHQFYRKNMAPNVHIEEFALNRPLPFEGYEGLGAAVESKYDLSENYALHIHPRAAVQHNSHLQYIYTDTEEQIRTRDNIYGAAARIAYFGSPDLIFKPDEKVYNRAPTIKLKPLPRIEPDNSG
uniref:uncharacterized protein LOC113474231 n=1 Tax=Ciona intestinalis TaxID=7719 RepID=UPI000EF50C3F|nr:uncharacterized protein LOC113474231 [Ciona intestinalis]|eukprot:XP_026690328.1 uncharacterized protein LOC113474231 [Ciona intestinalis]